MTQIGHNYNTNKTQYTIYNKHYAVYNKHYIKLSKLKGS